MKPETLILENGSRLHHLETSTSTMDEARALAREDAPHLTTVWAETQTAGRGRQGRVWHSQSGAGLYFTVIARINLEPEQFGLLPLLVGAVLCSSVRNRTGVQASLKWPNDLLAPDGRKLAGILVEQDSRSSSFLIGVGLNVRVQPFDLSNNLSAASLEEFCDPINRRALLLEFLAHIDRELLEVNPERTLEMWRTHQNMLGQPVRVTHMDGSGFTGTTLEISRTGTLLVKTETGIREISSGEVSLRLGL